MEPSLSLSFSITLVARETEENHLTKSPGRIAPNPIEAPLPLMSLTAGSVETLAACEPAFADSQSSRQFPTLRWNVRQ
jgi:hypothetical protein